MKGRVVAPGGEKGGDGESSGELQLIRYSDSL